MAKNISKIEKLIVELCPNGVEFKELGELGYFYGGLSGKTKDDFSDGNAKFVTYMNIFSNISVNTDIDIFVKVGEDEKQNKIEYGDVLFTGSSETPNECGMSSVLTRKINESLYLNSFCFGLRLNDKTLFLPEFLKYLFRDEQARKQIAKTASGVTRFNVSKKRFAKIKIPIPPIAVQEEIIKVLDNFTELEAELEARKMQYEYYRNKMLIDNEGHSIDWVSLSDVCDNTKNLKWSNFPDKEFEYIDLSSVDREKHIITETQHINAKNAPSRAQQIIHADDVIFGTTRPMLKRFCVVKPEYDGQICSTGFCVLRPNKSKVMSEYIYHQLATPRFYKYIEGVQRGASYPAVSDRDLKNYKISVPEISEQKRIVTILDKFDALVNDISIGLPAELSARRSQYEYYRGKLLTFKEYAK